MNAQSNEEIEAMNLYVEMLNESVHGLFTAYALLVISNKEVNKYVHLDSYTLLNLSNSEVQSNLFDKSDKQNYTTFQGSSPLQLIEQAKARSSVLDNALASRLNAHCDKIKIILNRINSLRFEISDYIDTHDLNQKESIYGVYDLLEESSRLFDQFDFHQNQILNALSKAYRKYDHPLYRKAADFHKITKDILKDLRNESRTSALNKSASLAASFDEFKQALSDYSGYNEKRFQSYLVNRVDSIEASMIRFENYAKLPRGHELYGDYYYYHNLIAKRFFNWSGPGFVRHLNGLLNELELGEVFLMFSEEPLIFNVIYPENLDERNHLSKELKKENPLVPMTLNFASTERKETEQIIPEVKERTIGDYIRIELYDPNMLDRDTVSLYLNGECILKDHALNWEKKELELAIDKNKELVLELQAENLGIISPNTSALSYRINGNRKRFFQEFYLNKGEKIKLQLDTKALK